MTDVRTEFLFQIDLTVTPPQSLGATPAGERRIVTVTGGTFEGPKLKGKVVPNSGGDWIVARPDGALQLDVRITLECDDGALIYMRYEGIRAGDPAVLARLNRGEAVDPSEYYFRISPRFETGSETYGWLNRILAVGLGDRRPTGPRYRVYEVL